MNDTSGRSNKMLSAYGRAVADLQNKKSAIAFGMPLAHRRKHHPLASSLLPVVTDFGNGRSLSQDRLRTRLGMRRHLIVFSHGHRGRVARTLTIGGLRSARRQGIHEAEDQPLLSSKHVGTVTPIYSRADLARCLL